MYIVLISILKYKDLWYYRNMPKKKTAKTTNSKSTKSKSSKSITSKNMKTPKTTSIRKPVSKNSSVRSRQITNGSKGQTNKVNAGTKNSKRNEIKRKSWTTVFILILIFNIGLLFYAIHTNLVLQSQYKSVMNQVQNDKKITKNKNIRQNDLVGTSWKLVKLIDKSVEENQLVSLTFNSETKLSGFNSCNNYTGSYKVVNDHIAFGQIAATMMACIPENMALSEQYEGILKDTSSYVLTDSKLKFLSTNGIVLAEFTVLDDKTLSATTWQVSFVNNGNQGVTSLIKDTKIDLNFNTDGTVSGSAGCNNYSGEYKYDKENKKVEIGPLVSTKKYCSTPDGVMEQEDNFFKALQNSRKYSIKVNELILRNENGSIQVMADEKL